MNTFDRSLYLRYSDALRHPCDHSHAVFSFFSENADINVVHPFNKLEGVEGYLSNFVRPLQEAFEGLYRRDDIFMSGQFDGQKWISCTGYYLSLIHI